MPKLLILKGLSASGKSYFADNLVKTDKTYRQINRDSLRKMLDCYSLNKNTEELVTIIEDNAILAALNQGYNVVSSNTNLNDAIVNHLRNLVKNLPNVTVEINDSFLSVPLQICIERDIHRPDSVGANVIMRQYERYVKPLGIKERPYTDFLPVKYNNDKTKPIACAFDLDGSLSEFEKLDRTAPSYRNPYNAASCGNDVLNEPLKKVLDFYKQNGYAVILVSGREDKYRPQTEAWLAKHNVQYDNLYMRKSGDYRKDYIIKDEIYENLILPTYYVEVVYDDREQVCKWLRLKGLRVFNVAAGNF